MQCINKICVIILRDSITFFDLWLSRDENSKLGAILDVLVELRPVCIGGCHWGRWSQWLPWFFHDEWLCLLGRCSLQMIAASQIDSILQACSRHGHGSRRLDSRGKQTNTSCPSTPSKCGRLKITLVLLLPSLMAFLWTFYRLIVSWSVIFPIIKMTPEPSNCNIKLN